MEWIHSILQKQIFWIEMYLPIKKPVMNFICMEKTQKSILRGKYISYD